MQKIPKVILLIETSREFGRELLRGVSRYSRLHGPWIFYREPSGLFGRPLDLNKWQADGAIVRCDIVRPEEAAAKHLHAVFAPRLGEHLPGVPCIIVNSIAAGEMGAEHLLDQGFKHFAFCGFSDIEWSKNCRDGFSKRVSKAGFEACLYEQPEALSKHSWLKEQEIVITWLKPLPKPIGVMVCTDYHGQLVLNGCKVAGIHVPEEVAVIGILNDDIICNLFDPPLSSIAFNVEEAGYRAAALLNKLMAGERVSNQDIIVEPTHVVTRQSTDVLVIEDHAVCQAVHFIRRSAKDGIQVTDVADMVGLSRRALEQHFRKTLGRSVLSEIKRVRVDLICQFLRETNMSLAEIASAVGLNSEKHIARLFRQRKGLNPSAYRRKYGHKQV